jgi:ribonucleotide reductase beta subunit family protein with ferritin-like domain
VPLKDIKNGDSVYQFKNGKITKTTASNKIERDYNGRMYEIGNKSSNCLVTPGHEMVYINKMGDYEKNTAKDIKYHSKIKSPAGGILENNSEEKLTWSERLQIAMQSDATRLYWINANGEKIWRGKDGGYNYEFTLTKQRKKDRLRLILNNTNIEFVEQDIGKETEFKIKYNNDNDYKTFTWVDLSNKNKDWCIDFVQECVEWDGYRGGSNMGFSTTNKKVADIFHAISVLAGYRTNLLTNKSKRGYKDCYKISISERSLTPSGHSYDKVEQGYSGMVYCVTVPSGIIITRRNGKVCVAGNCLHALFGVYLIKEIQKECPDWFNEDFYNKLYRACKKAYEAEEKIIDWIFEKGELDFLPKDIVKEFIKDRFNESLLMVGGKEVFEVDTEKLSSLSWFNEGVSGQTSTDFFHKKPVTYSKKTKSIKAGDLF